MNTLFNVIKSALLYVKAEASYVSGNYEKAMAEVSRAIYLVGERYDKPKTFDYDMLAARASIRLREDQTAELHILKAQKKIAEYNGISNYDQRYLLDYCDMMISEIRDDYDYSLRLQREDHQKVSWRIKRDYPLNYNELW